MNFKTTLFLLILVFAGSLIWWLGPTFLPWSATAPQAAGPTDAGTLSTLKNDLTAEKLTRIEVHHGRGQLVLQRVSGPDWSLPGGWPSRQQEVDSVVHLITSLADSRFAPFAVRSQSDLEKYGLDKPPVTVTASVGNKQYQLAFGEESAGSDRFSRATYLRLGENPEVIRLPPGLLTLLQRPQDHFQRRSLFPSNRVARDNDSQEKVERLDAQAIAARGPTGSFALTRKDDEWNLMEPVRDRVDPDRLKMILTSIPDIWAEQFVAKAKKDLAEFGLKEPEQTLRIASAPGSEITLLIGKKSQTKTRTITRPAPNMGGPPMPPQQDVIHEDYRYAKLAGNEQIFEIKADKLKDIFVDRKSLRDAQLARFRTDEARRLEITPVAAGQGIVLVKEKDHWRLQKPYEGDAEDSKITELLDKLAGLQARDKDVFDGVDPKAYGFAGATASVKVTAEEQPKGEAKTAPKKSKTFVFALGKHDKEKKHVYVRMEGIDRINAVEDTVLPLVERPALAYRGRRLLDYSSTDLAKIDVQRTGGRFTLEQVNGAWRLATPDPADVDSSKVLQLANDLGRLEVVEYVSESATPQALDQTYGLARPVLTAKVTLTDAKKPPQTLLIGKQRLGKPEYFAKLESAASVFAVKKEIRDALDQDSLAYRPLQIWQLKPEDIKELRIHKVGPEFRLRHEDAGWKISGPFEASAQAELIKPIEDELANLRCERYAAHAAKDLVAYGLDKPYLRVAIKESEKEKTDKPKAKTAAKERALLIGKQTEKDAKTRFARLEDGKAVFVLGEKVINAVDRAALDFLDPKLLVLDQKLIDRFQSKGPGGLLTIQRQGDAWRVMESAAPPFPADTEAMASLLGLWSNLRAQRFAAYGTKLDPAGYGLDKPSSMISVTVQPPSVNGKAGQQVTHTLILGKAVDGAPGERYARLDNGAGVAILGSSVVQELTRGYLDFVNRSVLRFDGKGVLRVDRRMGNETLDLVKLDTGWQLTKPAKERADDPTIDALVEELATLQAKRVAAYPAKDVKPYGLDKPAAIVTVQLKTADGKASEHVLKIGSDIGASPSGRDRFALVDKSDTVIVLPGSLAQRLTAPFLQFRDRNLARFSEVDRMSLQRGPRKAVFAKIGATWKMIQPIEAEAEQTDLEEFVSLLGKLRADELAADKPADLKIFGLDRPEAHWQVFAGDKLVLDLLMGGPEKGKETDGARHYAKLANDAVVFLCSQQLTTRALGEYRNRTIWAPLDASQIEKLSFRYVQNPYVLEKPDNDWRVLGMPEVKLQPEPIRDALDALAGIKAARYVLDLGADLKIYGLEPPQLVLEIQTRSGNRALHIGRAEGESKRFYARVPEGINSAVFVIAEADANRFIRPLTGFTQNKR